MKSPPPSILFARKTHTALRRPGAKPHCAPRRRHPHLRTELNAGFLRRLTAPGKDQFSRRRQPLGRSRDDQRAPDRHWPTGRTLICPTVQPCTTFFAAQIILALEQDVEALAVLAPTIFSRQVKAGLARDLAALYPHQAASNQLSSRTIANSPACGPTCGLPGGTQSVNGRTFG